MTLDAKLDQKRQRLLTRVDQWIRLFEKICAGQASGESKTLIDQSDDNKIVEQQMRQMFNSGFIVDPVALFTDSTKRHTGLRDRSLQADTRNYPLSFWSAKERSDLDQLIGGDHKGWLHLGTNGFHLGEKEILDYNGACVLTPDGPKALLLALYILRAKLKGEKAPALIVQSEVNKAAKKPFWHYFVNRLGLKKAGMYPQTFVTSSATATRGVLDNVSKTVGAPIDLSRAESMLPIFIVKTTGTHKIEELRRQSQGRAIVLTYAEVFGAVHDPKETSVTHSGNANEKIESCYIGVDKLSAAKLESIVARIAALSGYTNDQVRQHSYFFVDDRGVYFSKFRKMGGHIDPVLFPPGLPGPGAELKPITDNARGILSFMDDAYDYYKNTLRLAPDGNRYKDMARDVVVIGVSSVFGEDRTPRFYSGSVGCDLALKRLTSKADPCFGDFLYPWGGDTYISELEHVKGARSPFGLAFAALADELKLPALDAPQINIIQARDAKTMTSDDLDPHMSHADAMKTTTDLDGFLFTKSAVENMGILNTLALFYGMAVRRQMNERGGNTAIVSECPAIANLVDTAVRSGGMPQRAGLFQFVTSSSEKAFQSAVREHMERPKLLTPEVEEDFHDPMTLFAKFQDRPTIAIYCSATNLSKAYQEEAHNTALYLLRHGFNVISGAGSGSSMGAIVQAYHDYIKEFDREHEGFPEHSAESFGITAPHIRDLEGRADLPDGHVAVVRTLLERTAGLDDMADGGVWLPGGFGTAYEGFRTAANNERDPANKKPLSVMNNGGYYDFLKTSSLNPANLEHGAIHITVPQNDHHPRDRLTELGRWLTANALQIQKNFETRRNRLGAHPDKPQRIIVPYVLQAA